MTMTVHFFAPGSDDSACGERERCRTLPKERSDCWADVDCNACWATDVGRNGPA